MLHDSIPSASCAKIGFSVVARTATARGDFDKDVSIRGNIKPCLGDLGHGLRSGPSSAMSLTFLFGGPAAIRRPRFALRHHGFND